MKKITLLASSVLLLASVAFTSCKKEYSCECSVAGQTNSTSSTGKMNKKDAKTWCDQLNTAASALGGSCKLK